jgi:hypothetical protein
MPHTLYFRFRDEPTLTVSILVLQPPGSNQLIRKKKKGEGERGERIGAPAIF